jgi:hypothetical protein
MLTINAWGESPMIITGTLFESTKYRPFALRFNGYADDDAAFHG